MESRVNNDPQFGAGDFQDDDAINLNELLGVLLENRWLIAAITTLAIIIGTYNAFVAMPMYRADGLLPESQLTEHSES